MGVSFVILSAPSAFGMGKAPAGSTGSTSRSVPMGSGCSVNSSVARPVRPVVLKPVNTQVFQLPNGSRVDLSADLNSMLLTAVTGTSALSPTDPGAADGPCGSHLELRSTVSTLELNVIQAGISFGYNPTGVKPISLSVTGNVDVTIGSIAMDFSLWECSGASCTAVAATTANHSTSNVTTSFKVNFGVINTGPQFMYNTALGDVLRTIMTSGMTALAASSRIDELPWHATVRAYSASAGTLVFDAGTQSRIAPQQNFAVYAVDPATGACSVFKTVAYVHTTAVSAVSSTAVVDQVLDPAGVQVGDEVMVQAAAAAAGAQ